MNTVYVVMGNDFPDSVFTSQALADAYCRDRSAEYRPGQGQRRIYWRVYPFVLDRAPQGR